MVVPWPPKPMMWVRFLLDVLSSMNIEKQKCSRVVFDDFGCPENCFKDAFIIANMKYPLCQRCYNKFSDSKRVRQQIKKYSVPFIKKKITNG